MSMDTEWCCENLRS